MGRALVVLVVLLLNLGSLVSAWDSDIDAVERDDVAVLGIPGGVPGPQDATTLLSAVDGHFTENLGQLDMGAGSLYCIGKPLSVAFDTGHVAYALRPDESGTGFMFETRFVDAYPVEPVGVDPTPHRSNFLLGNESDKWVTGARSFREVIYPSLYDDIDLRYYFGEEGLKYDFILEPQADASSIKVEYVGVDRPLIEEGSGDLLIGTPVGTLRDRAPISYQMTPEGMVEVESHFRLLDGNVITVDVGDHDPRLPLVIDPGLEFSTYIGGSNRENRCSSIMDADGNMLITGFTRSTDFPVTTGAYNTTHNGEFDGYVSKLRADGSTLDFSTFFGGSDDEFCHRLAVDGDGEIYVVGVTHSTDFPISRGALQTKLNGGRDAFVFKLSPDGASLRYSTYLGGNTWNEIAVAIEVDDEGNAYISGKTGSSDFPVVAGCYDTTHNGGVDFFIVKMNRNATGLLGGTYIGGTSEDQMNDMCLDEQGFIYAAGFTKSDDFPTTASAFMRVQQGGNDAVVVKIDGNLSKLIYSTYLGGPSTEVCYEVLADDNGSAYVCGYTRSPTFPTTPGAYQTQWFGGGSSAFILKLTASGDKLVYSTMYSGTNWEWCKAIDIDEDGTVFAAIDTESDDAPITPHAYDDTLEGFSDTIVARFDPTLSVLEYASYLGGNGFDVPDGIIRSGSNTTVFGHTSSTNYPTTPGAFDRSFGGDWDLIVTRLETEPLDGTPPEAPRDLDAVAGDNIVSLSWKPPLDDGGQDLLRYKIYRGTSESYLTERAFVGPQTTSFEDISMMNGQTYHYAVTAFNLLGESNRSVMVNATPVGLPDPPTELTATPGCGTVHLAWSPPYWTGGVPITGFILSRGTSEETIVPHKTLGNVREHNDDDVDNGVTYHYRLRAFTWVGNSTLTDVVTALPTGPPGPPVNLRATPGDCFVRLDWDPPWTDGGSPLMGYRVFRGTEKDAMDHIETVLSSTSFVDRSLVNGRSYHYSVHAFSALGNGSSAFIISIPMTLPGIPRNLTTALGDREMTLRWDPPLSDGGSTILGYSIYRGLSQDQLFPLTEVNGTSHTDAGLLNGRTYYYVVHAINAAGEGIGTAAREATPCVPPSSPGDPVAESGGGVVTILWGPPSENGGSQVTRYNIYRGPTEDSMVPIGHVAGELLTYRDTDLVAGPTYHYAVSAVNAAGEGPLSGPVQTNPFGPPGAPKGLEAIPGNEEVVLFWKAPDSDGATPVTGYVVLRGQGGHALEQLVEVGEVNSYLDTSVENGQTYLYAVAAINAIGQGPSTEPARATPFRPAGPPGAVQGLEVEVDGTTVILGWQAPLDDGGSPVTGYTILRGTEVGSLRPVMEVGPGATTFEDKGLDRGTTYLYSVVASNEAGEGELIYVEEATIPKEKEEGPGFSVLLVVSSLLIIIPVTRWREGKA